MSEDSFSLNINVSDYQKNLYSTSRGARKKYCILRLPPPPSLSLLRTFTCFFQGNQPVYEYKNQFKYFLNYKKKLI